LHFISRQAWRLGCTLSLVMAPLAYPAGALFWFLYGNLKHGMPSWSRLPDERRWQLVSYLKSLATP